MEQQTPIIPSSPTPPPPKKKSRMKPRKSQNAPISHPWSFSTTVLTGLAEELWVESDPWFGGQGGTNFPSILSKVAILEPPSPQFMDETAQKPKRANFPL